MIKLIFKTITPLHISSGEELGYGLDYVIRYDTFCKIDFLLLSEIMANKKLIDFKKNYSFRKIIDLVIDSKNYLKKEDYIYRLTIRKDFYDLIENERAEGRKFVKEFVNSNNKFYIPASSVKGALLTVLNIPSLGITAGANANIKDKFVFRDSDYIPYDSFYVIRSLNRPPMLNMICLKPDMEFQMDMMKLGKLEISYLKDRLKKYSDMQLNNAKENISKFKSQLPEKKGADLFFESLENISNINLNNDEFLINLGFGGGSWFKVNEGVIPKFKSKSPRRRGQDEEAHTSVSFLIQQNLQHIGWCKLKIEE